MGIYLGFSSIGRQWCSMGPQVHSSVTSDYSNLIFTLVATAVFRAHAASKRYSLMGIILHQHPIILWGCWLHGLPWLITKCTKVCCLYDHVIWVPSYLLQVSIIMYRQISNTRRTKSQILIISRLVLQLSLLNPLKPGVKSRMKM